VSLDFFSTLVQSAKQHPAADEPVVLEWDFDFGGSFINTTPNHMPGVHVSLVFVSTLAQSAIQHPAADERVALAKFRDYMTRAYTHAHADAPLACGLLDFYLCASAIRILATGWALLMVGMVQLPDKVEAQVEGRFNFDLQLELQLTVTIFQLPHIDLDPST
jgi:hypothetical protein